MEELGSGFYLAMHDLEIRGAGEVLGENQSGNMLEVGFQLYNEMLSEAVRCLKAGIEPDLLSPLNVTTDINLHAPALLPDDYCGDVHLRLSFYKKLATAKTTDQVDTLLEEIVDRFGKLPPQAQTSHRRTPPARAGQAVWCAEGGRRAGRHQHHLPEEPAD
jgi:transcription-repair coupling factor (superfamily II helicase)